MAVSFDGASQYLEYAGTVRTTAPLSMSAFQYVASVADLMATIQQYHSSGNNYIGIDVLDHAGLGERAAWIKNGYTEYSRRQRNTDSSTGHLGIACSWSAYESEPSLYVNGASVTGTTTTGSGGTGTYTVTGCGSRVYGGTRIYGKGTSSECAIWSVQLSAQSQAAASRGFSPLLIQPVSLAALWPLGGALGNNYRDVVGQRTMTATGSPTFAAHPKTIYPCACQAC